jgi:benzoyl-CoA reductase/2-hydroxyglutaryl-CoA dehydratase subunit BcrC/BadD/HgdB
MRSVEEIFEIMQYTVTNISEVVKEAKAQGKKVIGTFPVYAPIEVIHAAGMLSVDCWGGEKVSLSRAAAYLPPFACSVVQSQLEFAATGVYDDLDAIIASVPCDTYRCNNQNVRQVCDVPVFVFSYAYNNKQESAMHFMVKELGRICRELEKISGRKIKESDLRHSIDVCNKFREELMRFSAILAEKPGIVSAKQRHTVFKAGGFMDKEEFTALLKELNDQLEAKSKPDFKGKRIYLAGIMAEPSEILDIMDNLGFAVVGDELAQESRRYRVQVPEGIDSLERLAKAWQLQESCTFLMPTAIVPRKQYITESAKELGADGIVYCQMTFCDPELYDFPDVRNYAMEHDFPIIDIAIDQTAVSFEQVHTRLQSFKEQVEKVETCV